ncbi:MAG: molecular chaperone DnaK, partial [Verrucomicrobiota bacterium]|nr:molecular chaperone DnaK [Verrucomicrobiota bacterium]
EVKTTVDGLLSEAKKVLEKEDADLAELKAAKENLQKSFEEIAKAAGPMPGPEAQPGPAKSDASEGEEGDKKDEDIVDADFEVVDDEDEKS